MGSFYMQLWQAPSFIAKILSTLNILSLSWLIWILRSAQLTLRIPPLSPPVRPRERLRSPGSCNSLQLRSGHSRRQCCLALLPGRANALTASSKQLPAGTSADTLSPQQLLKAAAASLPASVAPASCSSSPGILEILWNHDAGSEHCHQDAPLRGGTNLREFARGTELHFRGTVFALQDRIDWITFQTASTLRQASLWPCGRPIFQCTARCRPDEKDTFVDLCPHQSWDHLVHHGSTTEHIPQIASTTLPSPSWRSDTWQKTS